MSSNTGGSKTTRRVIYIITILISVAFIFFGNKIATKNYPESIAPKQNVEKAKVVEIVNVTTEELVLGEGNVVTTTTTSFAAEIVTGEEKGTEVYAVHVADWFVPYDTKELELGDKILLLKDPDAGYLSEYSFAGYSRTDGLAVLLAVFLVMLLLFGRAKGFHTVVSLSFTCLAIFAVFIPSVLSGINMYKSSVIICAFITLMTLIIVSGTGRKTIAAALGCLGGLLVSGILTLIMDGVLKLTGMVDEESVYLTYLNTESPIDLRAVIFASILIGALGAVMDVSMSISSALKEISDKLKGTSFSVLLKSGITIGRDIMGTMANTLILAYIGSSMSVVLLIIAYNDSMRLMLNREMIVVEILQALVGSLGILATIPLTSFVGGIVFKNKSTSELIPKSTSRTQTAVTLSENNEQP